MLQGKAKDLYFGTYSERLYNSFSDAPGKFHGGTNLDEATECFLHQPRHDVESVFWTIVSSVVRFILKNAPPEPTTNAQLAVAIDHLDSHVIMSDKPDSWTGMVDWETESFRTALHPGLALLAPMLSAMCAQIRLEYSYISPPPWKEHLHEAMQRLLLQWIVDMESNPIPLI
jgi:hypothetical protein